MTLSFPTIHMNGDSRAELLRVHHSAMAAIENAAELLAQCAPNMRNFYMHADGKERFRRADMEHRRRQDSLDNIRGELAEIIFAISEPESLRATSPDAGAIMPAAPWQGFAVIGSPRKGGLTQIVGMYDSDCSAAAAKNSFSTNMPDHRYSIVRVELRAEEANHG